MAFLVDTNILLRYVQPRDPSYALARAAVSFLRQRGEARVKLLERAFILLPDPPEVYLEWRQLVNTAKITGAQVHDARLAAVMRLSHIPHILTFNIADFTSFAGVTAVHLNTL